MDIEVRCWLFFITVVYYIIILAIVMDRHTNLTTAGHPEQMESGRRVRHVMSGYYSKSRPAWHDDTGLDRAKAFF